MVETKSSADQILSMEQKRNGFHAKYLHVCKSKNLAPVPEVKNKQRNVHVLDFHADRVRFNDWMAICEALHGDTTLKFIAIRLRKNNELVNESIDTAKKAKAFENLPVIYTNFVMTQLVDALENVLSKNGMLESLVIEGLPLTGHYLSTFVKGLAHNAAVEDLNFSRSKIGDNGCIALCSTMKHMMSIKNVNFSSCNLSVKGADAIADLVKFQKIQRFSEAWAQSLRYREVDPESYSGVRKIALNDNPQIGDKGLEAIVEVLQEDVWLKVIEMRNCGLTDDSAQNIIKCLNVNKTILNFYIAQNPEISEHLYRHIIVNLGTSESDNSDSTDSGVFTGKITKKDLLQKIKFLEEQLDLAIFSKKKTEKLYEKLQGQFTEVQKEALIQGAFKIPEGFTLIARESLDDLMKKAAKSEEPPKVPLKRKSKKKRQTFEPRKVKSAMIAKTFRKIQKISKSEVALSRQNTLLAEKIYVERNIGDCEPVEKQQNEAMMSGAELLAMMKQKRLNEKSSCSKADFDPRTLFTGSYKKVPQNSDAESDE